MPSGRWRADPIDTLTLPGATKLDKLLTNCTVIDGQGGGPVENAHVLISGDRIERVGSGAPDNGSTDAESIDLGGGYVLPGFFSTHVHLGDLWPNLEPDDESVAERTLRAACNAMDALRCGVTSMRSLGEHAFIDVALGRAFARGAINGPNIVASGNPIIAPGGHAEFMIRNLETEGAEAMRREVRRQIGNGVDCIKIVTTAGETLDPELSFGQIQFTTEELRAAIDTAHDAGKHVCTHTGTSRGVKQAVEAGVDCIEHGYVMDRQAVDLLLENNVFYTPTLTVTHNEEFYRRVNLAASQRERFESIRQRHAESFRLAYEAGVAITCGSDINPVGFCALSEIELMVRLGMSESDAIVAATSASARSCGIGHKCGAIAPGKMADLVVLEGNPLDDIGNIWKTRMVLKSGAVVDIGPGEGRVDFWDIFLNAGAGQAPH